jgi:ABC-type nickel/cobalt efflux system permease component RcnA
MSTHSIDESTGAGHPRSAEPTRGVWRGIMLGLIPLGLLISMVTVIVLLTALARLLFAGAGFFVQQQAAVLVLVVGLVLAIAVFALAVWRVLRHVAAWQKAGVAVKANAALWALGVSALVVVVPILLALLLPQHPFP